MMQMQALWLVLYFMLGPNPATATEYLVGDTYAAHSMTKRITRYLVQALLKTTRYSVILKNTQRTTNE
jgi:hypothetical protein